MIDVRTRTRSMVAVAGVTALLLAASACGSKSSDSGSEGATKDASVTFTGDPVTVMTMAPYDNDILDAKVMLTIAQGAVTTINNAGGVNGHELKLVTCNEGADPNKAQACARQAVSEKVSALVGGFTLNGDTVMPILEKAGIPWVGPAGISAAELSNKLSYPVNSGVLGLAGLGAKAAEDGCKKVASVNLDTPTSSQIATLVDVGLASQGHDKSTLIKVPPTTADFSGLAQQVKGYDCAVYGATPQAITGILAAGASLGSTTKAYIIGGALTTTETGTLGAAIEGAVSYNSYPVGDDPLWDDAKKAVGDLKSDAAGGWSSLFESNTWVAYQTFAYTVKDLDDFSAASVVKALDAETTVFTGGFTPTFSFATESPIPGFARVFNHQVQFNTVKNGKIVTDGPYVDLFSDLAPKS